MIGFFNFNSQNLKKIIFMMNAVMIKVRFYIWTNYGLKIDNKNYKKREIQMK